MGLNKILRNIILVGIFVVPFIPLYVADSMFFPFITGKNFVFRIVVEIILALWAILALRDKSYAPGKSAIAYAVGAFLAIITLADIFGANFYRSLWSNYERMEGLVSLLHLCGYFLVLGSVLNTDKLWDRYLKTIMGVGGLIVLYALAQLAGWFVINQGALRVDATFGNATYLAVHMLFLVFMALFYYSRTGYKSYAVLSLIYLFILYKTATRGALIGFVIGGIVSVACLALWGDERARRYSRGALAAIVLALVLFIPARNLDFVKNSQTLSRFSEINFENIMKEPRLMVWGMALEGFKENPVLGWGQDNFNLVFNKYYNPGMWRQEPWFDRAHDVFFDWLIAGGILGLGTYLAMFGAAMYVIWKNSGRLELDIYGKVILTGMFVAYFVQNIFVFDNLISYTMFFTMLAFLHFGARRTSAPQQPVVHEGREDALFTQVLLSLVLVFLVFTLYFVNVKPILTSKALIGALSSSDPAQSLAYFKQALAYNSFGKVEAREQLVQRAVVIRTANFSNDLKLEYFNLAKEEIQKQIEAAPDDARYHVFYATLLSGYGLSDQALAEAEKAAELSPKKQTILFQVVSAYINKGQYDKALELAKQVYELETSSSDSIRVYLMVAIYAKKDGQPEFRELFEKTYGTDTPPDDRFVNPYASVGRFDKVIEIWQKKVEKEPTNPQYHVSLAASYLANGQRTKAVEELREAIRINPNFKTEGERYISEILAGRNP